MIDKQLEYKVTTTLEKIGLPCKLNGLDVEKVYRQMLFDKKRSENNIAFILPLEIGKVTICKINNKELLKKVLRDLRE